MMVRHRVLALVASGSVIAGCGDAAGRTPTDAVEQTLRGFYAAVLRDRDFGAACRYAAPGFYLRPGKIVGINVKAGHPVRKLPRRATGPRRGPCADLAARVYARRGHQYPWRAWSIERVQVSKDGRTAQAVTSDGSAGLVVVDGEWRLRWVFDSA